MRYPTVAALAEAFRDGLGLTGAVLVIDNDDTHVYVGEECVFRMHPDEVLEGALDLLGVPHEPC